MSSVRGSDSEDCRIIVSDGSGGSAVKEQYLDRYAAVFRTTGLGVVV